MKMIKVVCIKDLSIGDCVYNKNEVYDYYSNFGGLNHFVITKGNVYPFDGPTDEPNKDISLSTALYIIDGERIWVFDYFQKIEEYRNDKLNEIGI